MKVPERTYRPELHGIRGLAILGVVLFHVFGAGRVSGGIDIFLAISGFLFTAMLLREAVEKDGRVDLLRYFARLVRRLLPPALVVIAFTVAMGLWLLPSPRHQQLLTEARASLLYFENIELINSQLAYEAAGPESSPFQHFWSLSVQGQFFLVWPLVAIAAVFIARLIRKSPATVMTVLVGAVLVASFLFSLHMGNVHQDAAYLMTRTRFWELAFGGILALAVTHLSLARPLRDVLGWLGLALVVTCGFFLDGAELFPGTWALWPLLGMAFVVLSAQSGGQDHQRPGTAAHLMSTKPLGWIGTVAYSLYLWHWPLLVFYIEFRGYESVGIRGGIVVVGLSLIMAWATYLLVEKPISQKWQPVSFWKPLSAGVAGLALGGAGLSAVLFVQSQQPEWDLDDPDFPGALATLDNGPEAPEDVDFRPAPEVLTDDGPAYFGWNCRQRMGDDPGTDTVRVCEDPEAPEEPHATILLAGGSHAGQWQEAFMPLAAEHGWELLVADKAGCRFGPIDDVENNMCHSWNEQFPDVIPEHDVDVVVTPGSVAFSGSDGHERIYDGAPERWEDIVDAGAEVLLLRGLVRPGDDVPECLARGGAPEECGSDYSLYEETNPLEDIDLGESMYTLDMVDYVCPEGSCPAVIGNVAVYRDSSHLSPAYAESLAPILEEHLREEMPHLFADSQ